MKNRKLIYSCLLYLCSIQMVWSQDFKLFQYISPTNDPILTTYPNLEAATADFQKIIPDLHMQGFITAAVDSFLTTDTSLHLFIFKGPQYAWKSIHTDKLPQDIPKNLVSYFNKKSGSHLLTVDIQSFTQLLLQYADEKGFPFAKVYFDEIQIDDEHKVSASIQLDLGKQYNIDSIHVLYEGRLDKRYFYKYLDIREGMPYDAKKLKTISPLIASLPYLQEAAPWSLKFGVNENALSIFLKERKANQANAILGLQPSSHPEKRFDITADVLFSFNNEMGYGEKMKFAYQQLQNNSPLMNVDVFWPYLFGSNFGLEGFFQYQKFDTSFRKTTSNIGVLYQFTAYDHVKVFADFQRNRIITFDTGFVSQQNRLPPNVDVSTNGGGLAVQIAKVNNILNPRSGYLINATLIGSQRKILPNNALESVFNNVGESYSYLYDSISAEQLQTKIRTSISGFVPIWKMFTVRLGYENGYINSKDLFRNELFQIGGFKLLRGFNELSIFSNHFHIGNIEPRILLGKLSYMYLFSDFGYVSTLNLDNRPTSFNVLSFGLGGTISTTSGIFNIAFGLGRQGDEKIRMGDTRVHFGYAVYF